MRPNNAKGCDQDSIRIREDFDAGRIFNVMGLIRIWGLPDSEARAIYKVHRARLLNEARQTRRFIA